MKIQKVQIKNFRSIVQTELNPQSDMTALVGGNESGKSNVILALINFFSNSPFSRADKHQLSSENPEIFIDFSLSDEEKKLISKISGSKPVQILRIKKSKEGRFIENVKFIPPDSIEEKTVISAKVEANESTQVETQDETPSDVVDTPVQTQSNENTEAEIIEEIPAQIVKIKKISQEDQIFAMLPSFVPVLSVGDLITGKDIPIKDLISAKEDSIGPLSTINAFLNLGDINLNRIKSTKLSLSEKTKMLIRGASTIGKRLREYWPQEDLKISITTDRKNISIHIRDGGCLPQRPKLKSSLSVEEIGKMESNLNDREDDTKWIWTNPDERSDGFRWFATFFAKYLSRVDPTKDTILVIDDLGVFLNASIQEVLYKRLFELSQNRLQLIYTTHSPYIVDFGQSKMVRLVEKKESGTNVIEEWWKKKSLKDLPQPLKDIGVSRSENILKPKNLLVEGATDISVIRRIAQIFSDDIEVVNTIEGTNMYPTGGSGESIGVALYCRVDGKKSAILFDSDTDALALNQRAQGFTIPSKDISTLSKPYNSSKFKIESIEDLIPDKLMVDALNMVGNEMLKEKWINIGNVRRKVKNNILGIMSAIKNRFDSDGFDEDDVNLILSSKNAIIEAALSKISIEEYDPERKIAVQNFLKNLSGHIESLN